MFYFEDTITEIDVAQLNDTGYPAEKDKVSVKPEPVAQVETHDSPEEVLERIRQVM